MQFKIQSLFIATFFLAVISCKTETKQPVDAAIVTKIESMEEQVKSVQPKIDTLQAVVKQVSEKYQIATTEQTGISMNQGQASEETNLIVMIADRANKIQAEMDKTLADYNTLIASYKAGTVPKVEAETRIKTLETEMQNLERGAAKTQAALLEVVLKMPEPRPAEPSKSKGQ